MSDKIKQLEEKIKIEKQNQRKKELNSKLKQLKCHVGKGMATHQLNTYLGSRSAYDFYAFYVNDVFISDDSVYFKITTAQITCNNGNYLIKTDTGVNYKDLPLWLGSFRYDINRSQMNEITKQFTAAIERGIDSLRHNWKQTDYISQGDHDNTKQKFDWIKEKSFIEIDATKYNMTTGRTGILELLTWNNHPFLYGNMLLNTEESITIVQRIADKIEDNARSWGGSILERDMPRVKLLRKFYNKHIQKFQQS